MLESRMSTPGEEGGRCLEIYEGGQLRPLGQNLKDEGPEERRQMS